MSRPGGYPYGGPPVDWVASPPLTPARPVRRAPARQRGYVGPPAYRGVPRWGFPLLTWRATESVPGGVHPPERTAPAVPRAARVAGPAIWAAAVAAGLGGLGEIFRYVLLVLGRDRALPGGVVAGSDALVNTAAGLAIASGLVAAGLTLRWLLIARTVAARQAGARPGRPDWAVLLGVLLPVLNLFMAGSVLSELEHTARQVSGRARGPVRPTRLVRAWWAVWAGNELAAVVTLVLRSRNGIQAQADGVLWHAVTDLTALALAVLTLRVVGAITALVAPVDVAGLKLASVVGVAGAPPPAPRPPRPAGAPR